MLKKVTIYIDVDTYTSKYAENESKMWNDSFIHNIIDTELDDLGEYGKVKGYTIEDITKP